MPPRRSAKRRRRTPAPEPVATLEAGASTPPVTRARLAEPPHSHIVCRSCGRISRLELQDAERQLLIALAAQRPAGWSVDGISFSLTGACARCREGVRA